MDVMTVCDCAMGMALALEGGLQSEKLPVGAIRASGRCLVVWRVGHPRPGYRPYRAGRTAFLAKLKMTSVLDGKPVAAAVRRDVTAQVTDLMRVHGVRPRLAVVLIGEDPASKVYVGRKRLACHEVGIETEDHLHPRGLAETDVLQLVRRLNADRAVHGILVQLPLPKSISERSILDAIAPEKDVDGLHPVNLGRLLIGEPGLVPCTPAGVLAILDHYGIPLSGKRIVVVGRSRLVGKPLAQLMLGRDATVIIAHSRTQDLPEITRQGDVLVVAVGRSRMIGADHVKPGSTVIDVGINRLQDGTLTGDVDFAAVQAVAGAITPAPGGVGPMTVAMLMHNTVLACRLQMEGVQV
jgi:methylenetetrahydrofolate dehydrogenase (NADP+)/methenyltetrahydrofolate cyclohydrolase